MHKFIYPLKFLVYIPKNQHIKAMCMLFFERRQKSLLKTLVKSPIVEKTFGYLVIHK